MPRNRAARSNRSGSRKSGAGSVSVNWGEAEISNRVTRPGTYAFKVTNAEEGDDGQIIVDAVVTSEGRQLGKSQRTYFNTSPKALWVLARFLEAVDIEVPDSEAELDLDELVGKEFIANVEENEYNGNVRLRIAATSFAAADEAEEEEEEEPAPKKGGAKKAPPVEEEEEEEEEAPKKGGTKKAPVEEEDDEEDEDEEPVAKRGRGRPPGSKNKPKAVEEDEEEEEKPSRKGPAKKSKLPKVAAEDLQDMNEEELDDLLDKYGLDVNLDLKKTLRGKAALVIDALEAEGLLEDE